MAYQIQTTDGTVITTITDGDIDNTTSLTLFGKSYSGFGEALNENLVKLLENSALGTQPASPLRGELWFDTTVNQLKVYDGATFKPTGGAKSQSSAPTSPSAGDLWLNTTNGQLFVRTGQTYAWQTFSGWELAGPVYTSGQTLSGFKIETITDNSAVSKVIASMYSGNTRVAILSAEGFIPGTAITGFATISAGLTLNSAIGAQFAGTTTTASNLNTSVTTGIGNGAATTVGGGNFMRKDVAQTTTGAITIAADTGLLVGAGSDLRLTVSGIDATIANVSEDGNLSIKINSTGNVIKTPIAITGSTGNIALTGDVTISGNLTISGSYDKSSVDVSTYVDAFIGVNEGNNTNVDGGIIVEQNSGVEARLFWDQSEGYWSAGKSNTTYSQIIRFDDLTADGDANKNTKALKTTAAGNLKVTSLTLGSTGGDLVSSGTKLTASAGYASADVPTKAEVIKSVARWGGDFATTDDGSNTIAGRRYVQTFAPTSEGADGDLWFVREP